MHCKKQYSLICTISPDERCKIITSLFDKLRPIMFDAAKRIVGYSYADDIVQDTFIKLILCPPDIFINSSNAWFYRVAFNAAIDCHRKYYRYIKYLDKYCNAHDDAFLAAERYLDIARSLKNILSANERAIVFLYIYEGKSFREISKLLKLNISAIYRSYHKAIEKMRNHLFIDSASEYPY